MWLKTSILTLLQRLWASLPVVCALLFGTLILLYVLRSYGVLHTWVRVTGPSLPNGLYETTISDTIMAGLPVEVCLEGRAGRIAVSRGYAHNSSWGGTCPNGASMVKIIAGIPGDTVVVVQDSVRINQRAWLHAPMLDTDSRGRTMESDVGMFLLSADECYALSLWSHRSYDSRYFGPFKCPHPFRIAYPLDPENAPILDSLRIVTLGG